MKLLFWLLVAAGVVYVGLKVVPVFLANYQLEDTMKQEARFAVANRRTPDDVRRIVYETARQLDLPLRPESIRVETRPGFISIRANYTVTVDLQVYQWTIEFHPSSGSM